jgi:hypothetical protein
MLSSAEAAAQNSIANYNNHAQTQRERQLPQEEIFGAMNSDNTNVENNRIRGQRHVQPLNFGLPVRRIRHAEVVLVDDVCIAYDRHWLRLRWPGSKGGFAGYVALGKVNETSVSKKALGRLQSRGMTCALLLFSFWFCELSPNLIIVTVFVVPLE